MYSHISPEDFSTFQHTRSRQNVAEQFHKPHEFQLQSHWTCHNHWMLSKYLHVLKYNLRSRSTLIQFVTSISGYIIFFLSPNTFSCNRMTISSFNLFSSITTVWLAGVSCGILQATLRTPQNCCMRFWKSHYYSIVIQPKLETESSCWQTEFFQGKFAIPVSR